jgi:hypothetical protein
MDSIFDDIDWFVGQTEDASEVIMEVGDDYTQPEDASSQDVPIPQFLAPHYQHQSPNPWPPKLVFDLALGLYSQEEVLLSNNISDMQFERLMEMPMFRQELAAQMREQRENGVTYQRKAAIQAETYLLDLDDMVRDKEIAAGTRLATIQYVTKVGGLEPKESKGADSSNATQVNLQINFT